MSTKLFLLICRLCHFKIISYCMDAVRLNFCVKYKVKCFRIAKKTLMLMSCFAKKIILFAIETSKQQKKKE